jgi:SAM-dependent methyltransferase
MRLRRLREDWERLGENDAYWAVLSDPAKRGGKWDVDAFYRSGETEIDYVMSYVDALRPGLPRGDALDFGCGPGRLTYALGKHFSHAVGLDISAPMIMLAEEHRGSVTNCDFVRNDRDDLSVLPDGSFDFVYSRIVLQHIPPNLARGYVGELVRVLRPGGLALFQLPDRLLSPVDRMRRGLSHLLRSGRDDAKKVRMFGVAQADVSRDVLAAGGRILHVAPDGSAGIGKPSWLYAVMRGTDADVPVPAALPVWRTP